MRLVMFQPTLPLRGATADLGRIKAPLEVSTHAPLAGSDRLGAVGGREVGVSTHAPLAGSDGGKIGIMQVYCLFQPTLPLRGATIRHGAGSPRCRCFNPRSPCGERPVGEPPVRAVVDVSTHAPLAGSDDGRSHHLGIGLVSTHAPLAGSDGGVPAARGHQQVSTHAPLAGSDRPHLQGDHRRRVSTHAPLAGSDSSARSCRRPASSFNPRSPCGERPASPPLKSRPKKVSTHAPLAGSDEVLAQMPPPHGVSTHAPLAGSDLVGACYGVERPVSTHAPLAGSDSRQTCEARLAAVFQPTLPLRGATDCNFAPPIAPLVSTHAPLAGSDVMSTSSSGLAKTGFNPRSPCGERLWRTLISACSTCFNPRSPCGERPQARKLR